MNRPTRQDALTAILLVSIIILVGLYLASIGPYWNIDPDSAGYVRWAKALAAGEGFAQPPVHPPVTSFVLAAILFWFPDGYTALNATTQFLILTSLAIAYLWCERQSGRNPALLVVLLALASIHVYWQSVHILAEPPYMVFSLGALLLLERPHELRHGPGHPESVSRRQAASIEALAGLCLVLSAMTRTIGVTLSLAVLLVEGLALVRRARRPRVLLIAFALLALAAVVLWELHVGQDYVSSWFRIFQRDEAGLRSAGGFSLIGTFKRLIGNPEQLLAFGAVFRNASGSSSLETFWRLAGILTFAVGLGVTLRNRVGVTQLYLLLYLAITTAHMVLGNDPNPRFIVPVLPLIFYYAVEAVRRIDAALRRTFHTTLPMIVLRALGALYVVRFVALGGRSATYGVREAHASPFGAYPIKKADNYDAQRLAFLLKSISRPEERYASAQRGLFNFLTERRGEQLPRKDTLPPDAFVRWIESKEIRYVLLDHGIFAPTHPVRTVLRDNPGIFHLVTELPRASLYQVRRPRGNPGARQGEPRTRRRRRTLCSSSRRRTWRLPTSRWGRTDH